MQAEEILAEYEIRKLCILAHVSQFDCGNEDLNDFIINDAPLYRKTLLAMTYIMVHKATDKVVAYFSVANDRISIKDFPSNTDFNRFRKHKNQDADSLPWMHTRMQFHSISRMISLS